MYNGWKTKATWNVFLWITSDEGLYRAAVDFMANYRKRAPYKDFIKSLGMENDRTPERFEWIGKGLCYKELNEAMKELRV